MVFATGLIHGLGFGGALVDLGLPAGAMVSSLLGFNLGVEMGQLLCVLVLLPVLAYLSIHPRAARRAIRGVALVVGAIGLSWLIERGAAL